MPVYKIKEDMPYEEFATWAKYFELRPPNWREDYAAFVIAQHSGMGGHKSKPEDLFTSIKTMNEANTKRIEAMEGAQRAAQTLRSSVFGLKLAALTEKGGK